MIDVKPIFAVSDVVAVNDILFDNRFQGVFRVRVHKASFHWAMPLMMKLHVPRFGLSFNADNGRFTVLPVVSPL